MKAVITISPASAISRATSPTRRMFSMRSASVKPEIAVEPVADVVAVEQEGVPAARRQLLLDEIGDGRLARPRQAGEPQHRRLLPLERGMRLAADVEMLAMDVVRPAKREVEHPGRDRRVGQLVDQDEAAERPVGRTVLDRIRLEDDLAVGRDLGNADARSGSSVFAARCSSVLTFTSYLGCVHGRRHRLRAELQPIAAAGKHLMLVHPDDGRFELVGDLRRIVGSGR